ncbi:hypothetical protein [Pseudoxanthomonas mexicana]
MRQVWIAAGLAAVVGVAEAKEPKWVFVAGSESGADFFALEGSRTEVKAPHGPAFQIDAKHVRANGEVRLVRYQVSKSDCAKGQGLLFEHAQDGTQLARNDYTHNVNSVAARLGNHVCGRKG